MATLHLTGIDVRLRDAVIRQLDWDPEVDDSAIGVAAKDGVVTLTGFIDSYAGKLGAERIVKGVRGVRAVANDIVVRLKVERTDADVAADAARALALRPAVPAHVQAVVHSGRVTLTGKVDWLLQKEQAAVAVRDLPGVIAVLNHIEVAPRATPRDLRHRIMEALHRNADVDARHIEISVKDGAVRLTGTVGSWMQRHAAEVAAGSAPGIREVDNQILVVPPEPHDFELPDEIY